MTVPLLQPRHEWYCPNCIVTAVTREARPHTEFHQCAGLHGLLAPLFDVRERVKVVAVAREDYVGDELVQVAPEDGRPYQSVVTTRDDGQDVAVFAPAARFGVAAMEG